MVVFLDFSVQKKFLINEKRIFYSVDEAHFSAHYRLLNSG